MEKAINKMLLDKIESGDVEIKVHSYDSKGVTFKLESKVGSKVVKVGNGTEVAVALDKVSDLISEDIMGEVRDSLSTAISNIAFYNNKEHGVDFEMSDLMLDTVEFIEDKLASANADRVDIVLNDKNDGFSSIVTVNSEDVKSVEKWVYLHKLNCPEWNIDSVEEVIKRNIPNAVIKHSDSTRVISL